ncbi:MAG: helix-turn-helix domain-containing protein [Comamonadaceae bacterium]|nr:helix-turn-helix domain-containing protein [Comamonadaceae bacterium]
MDYPIQSPGQLSSHLRALRKARGLTQAQLGGVLGVGQTRITRIERDPTAISVEQFLGILNALGVQMVLRPVGGKAASGPASAGRAMKAKRPPTDEPW